MSPARAVAYPQLEREESQEKKSQPRYGDQTRQYFFTHKRASTVSSQSIGTQQMRLMSNFTIIADEKIVSTRYNICRFCKERDGTKQMCYNYC